jgi:hypothetical protein
VSKEAWREDAKCASADVYPEILVGDPEDGGLHYKAGVVDTEIFYPPRDIALYKPVADASKAICKGKDLRPPCVVRVDCLLYAIERDEEHGIYGGASHRERNALVRKHKETNVKNVARGKATMTLRAFLEKGGPS